jgi:hypothetical protein
MQIRDSNDGCGPGALGWSLVVEHVAQHRFSGNFAWHAGCAKKLGNAESKIPAARDIENTVRYLGVDVDDALTLPERTEI